jgi:acetylornithine deacetylase/succinyl-diaminopimelate desuccinylase-like protein
MWTKPAVSVIGFDATRTADASNTLIPSVKAKISVRLAPGDSTEQAMQRLREHLERHVPWGAELTFTPGDAGEPTRIDATGPAYDAARAAFREAWDGVEPVDMGVGGSIPFIAAFREAYPAAAVLVTGVEDPDTRAHGANEGLHLAEFERVCLAEALLLHNLASASG